MTTSGAETGARPRWWDPEPGPTVDWLAWANELPLCRDLGLECIELDTETAVFRMQRPALTPNPNGAVNGGVVAAAADQVMGALTRRTSAHGVLPATATLHIQFHLPALAPITFRARSLGGGRRTKFVEVVVEDKNGNRCATSQVTMIAGGSTARPAPE